MKMSNRMVAGLFLLVVVVLVAVAAIKGDPGPVLSGHDRASAMLDWMWHHELPWLIVLGIPSIINGLGTSKETEGIRAVLGTMLELASVLAKSDAPGTFKLPFTTSPAPAATEPPKPPDVIIASRTPPVLLALIFVALALAGCGTAGLTVNAYKTLGYTAETLDASAHAFEQFDHDHQQEIAAGGKAAGQPHEAIEAQLQSYRGRRSSVTKAFAAAGAVVLVGQALIPLVEMGAKKNDELAAWLKQLLAAALDIQSALKVLETGGDPWKLSS